MGLGKYVAMALLGAGLFLEACSKREERTELSDILHEDAVVTETVFCPSRHGSDVAPTITPTSDGGSLGLTFVDIDFPEKYAVVFKCQHGKFIIQGEQPKYKALWEKLTKDQLVDVTYREVFKAVYDDTDKDGKLELVEKKLVKYDFIDATPKNAPSEKPATGEKKPSRVRNSPNF